MSRSQYTIGCFADISTWEVCTVTPPQKLDLDQMSESNVHIYTEGHKYDYIHFLLQILGLFASYDPVWTILMISVICHKFWMILTILFCDLLWRIKCPRTEFPTASLDITVYQFVSSSSCYSTVRPSDALDLKARVKQKGRISHM